MYLAINYKFYLNIAFDQLVQKKFISEIIMRLKRCFMKWCSYNFYRNKFIKYLAYFMLFIIFLWNYYVYRLSVYVTVREFEVQSLKKSELCFY